MSSLSVSVPITLNVNFRSFNKFLTSELAKAEADIIERLLYDAKETYHRYNHRTKNLRDATKMEGKLLSKKGLVLKVDLKKAKYGKYIIEGFKSWSPDPFLDTAYDKNKEWIYERIDRALKNTVIKMNRL